MKILFIHQNFPGQFRHLAPALASRGDKVHALSLQSEAPAERLGVAIHRYTTRRGSTRGIHPWLVDFESKVIRAEACFEAACSLRDRGFTPDCIVAHPGWGESLFLEEVWPGVPLGIYCEFFYSARGADVGFDPEFASPAPTDPCRMRLKNLTSLLHLDRAAAGIAPTRWQADSFPEPFRSRLSVIHDGIDTDALAPRDDAFLDIATAGGDELRLDRSAEVITFVNRNLEPYRGFHVFLRALPELLKARPEARVVIVGGDGVSYGSAPPGGGSWKEVLLREVTPRLPADALARIHFVGRVPYARFVTLLQLSRVHVYLTYPFVLSWSLLEAMSVGCCIVGSDTPPVREVIESGETGELVDFFDGDALVGTIAALLDDPDARARLGANARAYAREHYDLRSHCLPRQLAWVDALPRG